jgi:hypothetical protein
VSPWKTVAFATADVGLVGVVVGAIFGGLAVSGNDAAESSGCSGARCSPSAAATRNQAQSMADVSTASLAIGGVLLAGGITLWWLAPEAAQPRPAVGLSAGPASLMLRGSW